MIFFFFFSSRRRHTRCSRDWSSDVCSSDLIEALDGEHLHTFMGDLFLIGIGDFRGIGQIESGTECFQISVEIIEIYVVALDRKSTRLNSSHGYISYAVFCLKKKKNYNVY